jgi:hypothetical protein
VGLVVGGGEVVAVGLGTTTSGVSVLSGVGVPSALSVGAEVFGVAVGIGVAVVSTTSGLLGADSCPASGASEAQDAMRNAARIRITDFFMFFYLPYKFAIKRFLQF